MYQYGRGNKNFGLVPEICNNVNLLHTFIRSKPLLTRERFRDNFAALLMSSLIMYSSNFRFCIRYFLN